MGWLSNLFENRNRSTHNGMIAMPEYVEMHNGTHERCDMLIGPCACGAWHTIECWDEKIGNVSEYIDSGQKIILIPPK